jgi:hypothetical protein
MNSFTLLFGAFACIFGYGLGFYHGFNEAIERMKKIKMRK